MPNFTKATSVSSSRYNKNDNLGQKKRPKSESELLIDDFNEPPKILAKKKDNTIISKIYSQPHVRKFALSSRQHVPAELPTPNLNSDRYNGSKTNYNSEGETPFKKISTEDLSNASRNLNISGRSKSLMNINRISVSSEEDFLSEHSPSTGLTGKQNIKSHIYNSSDDLFSIEEKETPQKKKDNTLIGKIYQDPQVRNYALLNRDNIRLEVTNSTTVKNSCSSEEEIPETKTSISSSNDIEIPIKANHKSNYFHSEEKHVVTPNTEMHEIANKKIVHTVLDKFSTKTPVVMRKSKYNSTSKLVLNDTKSETFVSVKELRKKFEKENVSIFISLHLTYEGTFLGSGNVG